MKYGKAGKSVRKMRWERRQVVIVIAVLLIFIAVIWTLSIPRFIKLGLPFMVVLVTILWLVTNNLEGIGNHFIKRAKDAERGVKAEELVGEKLNTITGYTCYHDIVFDGFNIDHLLIGPGGVFVIETKSHKGKITNQGDSLFLNGKSPGKNFLNQAWSQTYQIKEILKQQTGKEWPVKPVLCFSDAFVEVRGSVKGISILNVKYLNTFISKQKTILSADDISRITSSIGGGVTEIQYRAIPD